jgi:hypothetical protein
MPVFSQNLRNVSVLFVDLFLLVKIISMATKEKTDPAWDHCQLIGGKMVSNHSPNETGWRGDLVYTGYNILSTCKREYITLQRSLQ